MIPLTANERLGGSFSRGTIDSDAPRSMLRKAMPVERQRARTCARVRHFSIFSFTVSPNGGIVLIYNILGVKAEG